MTEESFERDQGVQTIAKTLGLKAEQTTENEWWVDKGKRRFGYMYFLSDEVDGGEMWGTVEGLVDTHRTPGEGLQHLAQLSRKVVFTVFVECDQDCTPDKDEEQQMADVLAEIAFAFRHKLTPKGSKFRKVTVKARGVEAEQVAT